VEVAPAGRENQTDEADGDREPADDLPGAATERRQSAHQQCEASDGSNSFPNLREPDACVALDRDCECEHGAMIKDTADSVPVL